MLTLDEFRDSVVEVRVLTHIGGILSTELQGDTLKTFRCDGSAFNSLSAYDATGKADKRYSLALYSLLRQLGREMHNLEDVRGQPGIAERLRKAFCGELPRSQ